MIEIYKIIVYMMNDAKLYKPVGGISLAHI